MWSKLSDLPEQFCVVEKLNHLCIIYLMSSTCFWQEKAPYGVKAAKKKTEYEKLMNAYNKKQVNAIA